MNWKEITHSEFGRSLYADNGIVELVIPLEYGIRIGHFSFVNGENVFYCQPKDMTELTTEQGWRIYGGHRLWLAPEKEDTYSPDNEPISYEIQDDKIVVIQPVDPWTKVKKSMTISFDKNSSVQVTHRIENCGFKRLTRSMWCVSVVAPGGTEYISLGEQEGSMSHWHRISWWDHTSLGDVRATYKKNEIQIQHMPVDERYKIGIAHPVTPVRYVNNGVIFEKDYDVNFDMVYPDGNVSFETFFCRYMAEIESLSPLYELAPGESAEHTEIWRLKEV